MQNINEQNINEFLDWLSVADLSNILNHGGEEAAVDGDDIEVDFDNGDDMADSGEEESEEEGSEGEDEGLEVDRVDMIGEGATLRKSVRVGSGVNGQFYCTTLSFIRVPTEVKNYLLCQLCYWRYMEWCHPLTNHEHSTVHRTTDYTSVPRLYCGACACNLFTIANIATCTQCNNIEKK